MATPQNSLVKIEHHGLEYLIPVHQEIADIFQSFQYGELSRHEATIEASYTPYVLEMTGLLLPWLNYSSTYTH